MSEFPQIPGYKIERELGEGGMAKVYLGVQEKLNRKVAIKVMEPLLLKDITFSKRFMKEAETAANLNHSNIVSIYDVGHSANNNYIVMEYLHDNLKNIIKHDLQPSQSLKIIKDIAKALDYAHSEGFLHRDIKADNIMFRKDGTPVLVDFGIAKANGAATKYTRTGMSIGTPHYMSPEQCRGDKEIDGRSDIYSLGILLFEMLTGKIPYEAENTVGIVVKHLQEPVPELPQDLSKYQSLINTLMAKDPNDRPQTCGAVLDLINSIESGEDSYFKPISRGKFREIKVDIDEIPPEKISDPKIVPVSQKSIRSPLVKPLIISLVILVAILLGYVLIDSGDGEIKQKKEIQKKIPSVMEKKGANIDQSKQERNYRDLLAVTKQYITDGEYNKALKKLDSAREIKNGPEIEVLRSEIDGRIQQEKDRTYSNYLKSAKRYYNQGNFKKAQEKIALAKQIKTSYELGALEQKIENKFKETEQKKLADNKKKVDETLKNSGKRQQRKPGLNFKIEDLELEAIMKISNGPFQALVKGPDNKPIMIKVDDSVYDGEVIRIDSQSITFKRYREFTKAGTKDEIIAKQIEKNKIDSNKKPSSTSPSKIVSIEKPEIIKRVTPVFPITALRARIKGIVTIEAMTDISGNVVQARVIKGHPLLNQAAINAIMQWKYKPYIVDGIPKPVKFFVSINFGLSSKK